MGTSQSAIDRLESGGVGATLTTLQRVAFDQLPEPIVADAGAAVALWTVSAVKLAPRSPSQRTFFH